MQRGDELLDPRRSVVLGCFLGSDPQVKRVYSDSGFAGEEHRSCAAARTDVEHLLSRFQVRAVQISSNCHKGLGPMSSDRTHSGS